MDWSTYKGLCDRADYWSDWFFAQCIELLSRSTAEGAEAVAAILRRDQGAPALPRPVDHAGDERTLMYQVTLTSDQCQTLLKVIEQARVEAQFTSATQIRGLGGFAESCEELIRWHTMKDQESPHD